MSAAESIFYLCQSVRSQLGLTSFGKQVNEESITLHFYVKAEDGTTAGGAAGTFALEYGLECIEYICLPQPISKSQIDSQEREHAEAYELALKKGMAVVASSVLTWA